jgi:outer membrane protein assembly factor BamA
MSNLLKDATQEDGYSNDEVCRMLDEVRKHRFGHITAKVIEGKIVTVEKIEVHKKKK